MKVSTSAARRLILPSSARSKCRCFVIFHLLGDPVDSLWNLLLKLRNCQRRAKFWTAQFNGLLHKFAGLPQHMWKSLTLITDGYDEWDQGEHAIKVLQTGL